MADSSRRVAIKALVQQGKEKRAVDEVLAPLLEKAGLRGPDRSLTMALVYTVLRRRGELDGMVQKYSNKKLAKLDPLVLAALRVGVVQLMFMERIPASAAVNETVKGLGRQPKWLKGFVNGVLRAVARQQDKAGWICQGVSPLVNHPVWLTEMLVRQYGAAQAEAICRANDQQPSLALRLNSKLTSQADYSAMLAGEGIASQPGPAPFSLLLPDFSGAIDSLPGYAQGLFHVQDSGAQLACEMLGSLGPGRYLDGCAGLGGKTIVLDQLLPPEAQLLAVEPQAQRFKLLKQNLRRSQCRSVGCHQQSLADFAASQPAASFQAIVLDVPCSGLGVIRRQPDIRWNRSPADLQERPQQQLALLETAAPLLAPAGHLLYITCSLARQENEEVIAAFLHGQSGFTSQQPQVSHLAPFVDDQGFLHTLPSQEMDGFFACCLHKDGRP